MRPVGKDSGCWEAFELGGIQTARTNSSTVGYRASRKLKSEINQTGTHCCELGCLNVTLLIPVP